MAQNKLVNCNRRQEALLQLITKKKQGRKSSDALHFVKSQLFDCKRSTPKADASLEDEERCRVLNVVDWRYDARRRSPTIDLIICSLQVARDRRRHDHRRTTATALFDGALVARRPTSDDDDNEGDGGITRRRRRRQRRFSTDAAMLWRQQGRIVCARAAHLHDRRASARKLAAHSTAACSRSKNSSRSKPVAFRFVAQRPPARPHRRLSSLTCRYCGTRHGSTALASGVCDRKLRNARIFSRIQILALNFELPLHLQLKNIRTTFVFCLFYHLHSLVDRSISCFGMRNLQINDRSRKHLMKSCAARRFDRLNASNFSYLCLIFFVRLRTKNMRYHTAHKKMRVQEKCAPKIAFVCANKAARQRVPHSRHAQF